MFCDINGNKREDLNIKCSQEEINSLRLIRNKVTCATQALNSNMIRIPQEPPETSSESVKEEYKLRKSMLEEQARFFVKGAIDAKAEANFLEEDWWTQMIKKYNLTGSVFIDFETCDFYRLLDKDGKYINGNEISIK